MVNYHSTGNAPNFTDELRLAFIPINLYNGKRGFIRGKVMKYAFYAAYPVHIMIIYLIRKETVGF